MSRVILKKISIIQIDCDAVVNPANTSLKAGGGVCGLMFEAAGYEELTKACKRIGGVKTGGAAITPAFNMKQKYIIHAVGPIWTGGENGEAYQLRSAYRSALELAAENGCRSIGFPLISAGIYGYPIEGAWKAALEEVYEFLKETRDTEVNMDIYFTSLDDETLWIGKNELDRQQALFEAWCEQADMAPALYSDEDDVAGLFETRIDPGLIREMGQEPLTEDLSDKGEDFVFFWNDDEENGFLSQWYHAQMSVDGVTYTSCEQYMMAKKALAMEDVEYYILIMHESDPAKIKKLGREIRNFDSEKWSRIVPKIIYEGNLAKFSQNIELKNQLFETGHATLAEASPVDTKYGIGLAADDPEAKDPSKWKGDNLMGETLMRVRETLRRSEDE